MISRSQAKQLRKLITLYRHAAEEFAKLTENGSYGKDVQDARDLFRNMADRLHSYLEAITDKEEN